MLTAGRMTIQPCSVAGWIGGLIIPPWRAGAWTRGTATSR